MEVEEASEKVEDREEEENEERYGPEEEECSGGEGLNSTPEGVSVFCGFTEGLPEQGLATEREAYAEITSMKSG